VADRIRAVQADLDKAWPPAGPADLAWASSSLHHMADPDRVLTEVFAALRPGGLLVVAEMDSFPRFLPDDLGLGHPGLEARCHAALAEGLARELPHLGSDWGSRLSKAGFAIEAERTFTIDLTPPLPPSARRYAQATLQRIRSGMDGRISAGDLATLDTLIDSDPQSSMPAASKSVRHTARCSEAQTVSASSVAAANPTWLAVRQSGVDDRHASALLLIGPAGVAVSRHRHPRSSVYAS
jgi:hypothetical protein